MRKIVFVLVFLAGPVSILFSQVTNCPRSKKQADLWFFGEKAGIDFRTGNATPVTNQDVMVSLKSGAVMCDSIGDLLFFSNGKNIWDKNYNSFDYAPSLEGDVGVTQTCVIVPKPDDSNLYYVFTIDGLDYNLPPDTIVPETKGLCYSVVDMNLNNGLGDGTLRWNIPLLSPVTQKLTAVKHQNGTDYWVVAHKWDSDEFYAYPVTKDGIGNPVVSSAGSVHGTGFNGYNQGNDIGYMKLSPNGKKIALAIPGKNKVELFDFNNATGVISSAQSYTFNIQGILPFGIEFSANGKMLYTSLFKLGGLGPPQYPSRVYQFNLTGGLTNPVMIDSVPGMRIGGMQLATDGRIYVSKFINVQNIKDTVDVIYNPSRPGKACNYNMLDSTVTTFSLGGKKIYYGFPNFIQSYVDVPVFTHDSVCDGNVTLFNITNLANVETVSWDFGDGATSTDLSPSHYYSNTGTYTVKLTEVWEGVSYTDSLRVTVWKLPPVSFGSDTLLLYDGASVKLHAGGGYREYLWNTNSTDSIITVNSGGKYWTKVMDDHCCYNSDSIYINMFKYYLPGAFTPNGDGLNDNFRVIGLYENINIKMYIYDRWGKLCFESDNKDEGWDGKINGQPAPGGAYSWILHIDFPGGDIITNGKVVYKGTVILIR